MGAATGFEPSVAGHGDGAWAHRILAVDPAGIGGIRLRSAPGPAREAWLAGLRAAWAADAPWRRLPSHIDDDRLLGGLDLAATLRSGRTAMQPGLLAQVRGGVLVMPMAERCQPHIAARIAQAMEPGMPAEGHAAIAVVAFDEGRGDDPPLAPAIAERLGLDLRLADLPARQAFRAVDATPAPGRDEIDRARALLPRVTASDAIIAALCEAAQVLGIDSLRAPGFALRAARAVAALEGRCEVCAADAALAARLVLGPRARAWPQAPAPAQPEGGPHSAGDNAGERDPDANSPEPAPAGDNAGAVAPDRDPGQASGPGEEGGGDDSPAGHVTAAAAATLPLALLASIAAGAPAARTRAVAPGRAAGAGRSAARGRPLGAVRGPLRGPARLDLLATLRAAAPWQAVRRRAAGADHAGRLFIEAADFQVRRYRERRECTTVFAVDASGSQALHRLAEAKGAVELLLADCYARRDRVGVIAFRGSHAELLLPPTRSLVQARRRLAGLPGGGGTPLASGLTAAHELSRKILRDGGTPLLVLLTDGSANVALDGSGGRARAFDEALQAARGWSALGAGSMLIDTSPRGQPRARALAEAMGARYVALPGADASALARTIVPGSAAR